MRHHVILSSDCKMSAYARHVDGKERRDRRIWWDVGTVWNGCLQMRYSFEFMYPDFFDAGSHASHCRCDMLWPFDLWHVTGLWTKVYQASTYHNISHLPFIEWGDNLLPAQSKDSNHQAVKGCLLLRSWIASSWHHHRRRQISWCWIIVSPMPITFYVRTPDC